MRPVAATAEFAAGSPDLPSNELLPPLNDHAGVVATRAFAANRVRYGAQSRRHVARNHPAPRTSTTA